MTRKPITRPKATQSAPFATFAIDFQLALLQEHIDQGLPANDDPTTVEVRKRHRRLAL